jgi:hypothetical protein
MPWWMTLSWPEWAASAVVFATACLVVALALWWWALLRAAHRATGEDEVDQPLVWAEYPHPPGPDLVSEPQSAPAPPWTPRLAVTGTLMPPVPRGKPEPQSQRPTQPRPASLPAPLPGEADLSEIIIEFVDGDGDQ